MDILWAAVGVCVIVGFMFYILARQWSRTIRQHSLAIRRLSGHMHQLDGRLEKFSLVPLEHVFALSFRLSDHFWNHELKMKDKDWEFVRKFGTFVGSVKIERWRSHWVAAITELLPGTAKWQTRSLHFYPDESRDVRLTLWELRFPLTNEIGRPVSLELLLGRSAVELHGCSVACAGHISSNGNAAGLATAATVFFRIPVEAVGLEQFRSRHPADDAGKQDGNFEPKPILVESSAWPSFYSHKDEDCGIEWDVNLWDLKKKAEWESWRLLDSTAIPVIGH